MSLAAGRRNRRIVIERATATRNDLNEPVLAWAEYAKAWAAVYFGTGAEQRQAAQEQAAQTASFEVLSNSKTRDLSVTDRISFDGGVWNIRSIVPIGLNEGIRLTAVRAVP